MATPVDCSTTDESVSCRASGDQKLTRLKSVPTKLRVYVGYDPRLHLPYEVTKYSMLKRASIPVEVIPIRQSELRNANVYTRARDPNDITEFTLTRFLTPFLAGFEGWAMFVDSDFLFTGDVRELVDLIDDRYAVMCVRHDYTGKETTLMDGQVRTTYPRLNWTSMVLYNCSHPKIKMLTPEFVGMQTGTYLQKLTWLDDDDIGALPQTWNFLVGHSQVSVDDEASPPRAIHFTEGGPWYDRWSNCQFSDIWFQERDDFERSKQVQQKLQDELVKLMEKKVQFPSGVEREGKMEESHNAPEKAVSSATGNNMQETLTTA